MYLSPLLSFRETPYSLQDRTVIDAFKTQYQQRFEKPNNEGKENKGEKSL